MRNAIVLMALLALAGCARRDNVPVTPPTQAWPDLMDRECAAPAQAEPSAANAPAAAPAPVAPVAPAAAAPVPVAPVAPAAAVPVRIYPAVAEPADPAAIQPLRSAAMAPKAAPAVATAPPEVATLAPAVATASPTIAEVSPAAAEPAPAPQPDRAHLDAAPSVASLRPAVASTRASTFAIDGPQITRLSSNDPARATPPGASAVDGAPAIVPVAAQADVPPAAPAVEPTAAPAIQSPPPAAPVIEAPSPAAPAIKVPSVQPAVPPSPAPVAPAIVPAPAEVAAIAPTGAPQVVCASIMQINDQFLTIDDLLRRAAIPLSELPDTITEATFRREARTIIEDQARRQTRRLLIFPEADARMGEKLKEWLDNEMDQVLRDMVAHSDGSQRKLETRLRSIHTSLDEVLLEQRQQLLVQEFLRWKFMSGVSATRAQMMDYYRANPGDFTTPAKVQMQLIAVPLVAMLRDPQVRPTPAELDAARRQARERIEQAKAALDAGEDFAAVAKRFSRDAKAADGGLWPMISQGSFKIEAVEKAAFGLQEGQTSPVIALDEGFYIVRAYKVQPGAQVSFEQAQAGIERKLREQQLMKCYEDYYRQVLAKATVVESGNFVDCAVDRAVQLYWRQPADLE